MHAIRDARNPQYSPSKTFTLSNMLSSVHTIIKHPLGFISRPSPNSSRNASLYCVSHQCGCTSEGHIRSLLATLKTFTPLFYCPELSTYST